MTAEFKPLKLKSPCGQGYLSFDWNESINNKLPSDSIMETIRWVCKEYSVLKSIIDIKVIRPIDRSNYEDMQALCGRFNHVIDTFLSMSKGTSMVCGNPVASSELLKWILEFVYIRAIPQPLLLNKCKPNALPETYGETNYEQVKKILQKLNVQPDDMFIDLGSGVGHIVLQVAASTPCRTCIGIEKESTRAHYATQMEKNFNTVMKWFGKKYHNYQLIKGDFLDSEFHDLIYQSTIIFVNNFAFRDVNHKLKALFGNLENNTRIVSTYPFRPESFRLSDRNLDDPAAIMRVSKYTSDEGAFSWTQNPVPYFVQIIDRGLLQEYFDNLNNQDINKQQQQLQCPQVPGNHHRHKHKRTHSRDSNASSTQHSLLPNGDVSLSCATHSRSSLYSSSNSSLSSRASSFAASTKGASVSKNLSSKNNLTDIFVNKANLIQNHGSGRKANKEEFFPIDSISESSSCPSINPSALSKKNAAATPLNSTLKDKSNKKRSSATTTEKHVKGVKDSLQTIKPTSIKKINTSKKDLNSTLTSKPFYTSSSSLSSMGSPPRTPTASFIHQDPFIAHLADQSSKLNQTIAGNDTITDSNRKNSSLLPNASTKKLNKEPLLSPSLLEDEEVDGSTNKHAELNNVYSTKTIAANKLGHDPSTNNLTAISGFKSLDSLPLNNFLNNHQRRKLSNESAAQVGKNKQSHTLNGPSLLPPTLFINHQQKGVERTHQKTATDLNAVKKVSPTDTLIKDATKINVPTFLTQGSKVLIQTEDGSLQKGKVRSVVVDLKLKIRLKDNKFVSLNQDQITGSPIEIGAFVEILKAGEFFACKGTIDKVIDRSQYTVDLIGTSTTKMSSKTVKRSQIKQILQIGLRNYSKPKLIAADVFPTLDSSLGVKRTSSPPLPTFLFTKIVAPVSSTSSLSPTSKKGQNTITTSTENNKTSFPFISPLTSSNPSLNSLSDDDNLISIVKTRHNKIQLSSSPTKRVKKNTEESTNNSRQPNSSIISNNSVANAVHQHFESSISTSLTVPASVFAAASKRKRENLDFESSLDLLHQHTLDSFQKIEARSFEQNPINASLLNDNLELLSDNANSFILSKPKELSNLHFGAVKTHLKTIFSQLCMLHQRVGGKLTDATKTVLEQTYLGKIKSQVAVQSSLNHSLLTKLTLAEQAKKDIILDISKLLQHKMNKLDSSIIKPMNLSHFAKNVVNLQQNLKSSIVKAESEIEFLSAKNRELKERLAEFSKILGPQVLANNPLLGPNFAHMLSPFPSNQIGGVNVLKNLSNLLPNNLIMNNSPLQPQDSLSSTSKIGFVGTPSIPSFSTPLTSSGKAGTDLTDNFRHLFNNQSQLFPQNYLNFNSSSMGSRGYLPHNISTHYPPIYQPHHHQAITPQSHPLANSCLTSKSLLYSEMVTYTTNKLPQPPQVPLQLSPSTPHASNLNQLPQQHLGLFSFPPNQLLSYNSPTSLAHANQQQHQHQQAAFAKLIRDYQNHLNRQLIGTNNNIISSYASNQLGSTTTIKSTNTDKILATADILPISTTISTKTADMGDSSDLTTTATLNDLKAAANVLNYNLSLFVATTTTLAGSTTSPTITSSSLHTTSSQSGHKNTINNTNNPATGNILKSPNIFTTSSSSFLVQSNPKTEELADPTACATYVRNVIAKAMIESNLATFSATNDNTNVVIENSKSSSDLTNTNSSNDGPHVSNGTNDSLTLVQQSSLPATLKFHATTTTSLNNNSASCNTSISTVPFEPINNSNPLTIVDTVSKSFEDIQDNEDKDVKSEFSILTSTTDHHNESQAKAESMDDASSDTNEIKDVTTQERNNLEKITMRVPEDLTPSSQDSFHTNVSIISTLDVINSASVSSSGPERFFKKSNKESRPSHKLGAGSGHGGLSLASITTTTTTNTVSSFGGNLFFNIGDANDTMKTLNSSSTTSTIGGDGTKQIVTTPMLEVSATFALAQLKKRGSVIIAAKTNNNMSEISTASISTSDVILLAEQSNTTTTCTSTNTKLQGCNDLSYLSASAADTESSLTNLSVSSPPPINSRPQSTNNATSYKSAASTPTSSCKNIEWDKPLKKRNNNNASNSCCSSTVKLEVSAGSLSTTTSNDNNNNTFNFGSVHSFSNRGELMSGNDSNSSFNTSASCNKSPLPSTPTNTTTTTTGYYYISQLTSSVATPSNVTRKSIELSAATTPSNSITTPSMTPDENSSGDRKRKCTIEQNIDDAIDTVLANLNSSNNLTPRGTPKHSNNTTLATSNFGNNFPIQTSMPPHYYHNATRHLNINALSTNPISPTTPKMGISTAHFPVMSNLGLTLGSTPFYPPTPLVRATSFNSYNMMMMNTPHPNYPLNNNSGGGGVGGYNENYHLRSSGSYNNPNTPSIGAYIPYFMPHAKSPYPLLPNNDKMGNNYMASCGGSGNGQLPHQYSSSQVAMMNHHLPHMLPQSPLMTCSGGFVGTNSLAVNSWLSAVMAACVDAPMTSFNSSSTHYQTHHTHNPTNSTTSYFDSILPHSSSNSSNSITSFYQHAYQMQAAAHQQRSTYGANNLNSNKGKGFPSTPTNVNPIKNDISPTRRHSYTTGLLANELNQNTCTSYSALNGGMFYNLQPHTSYPTTASLNSPYYYSIPPPPPPQVPSASLSSNQSYHHATTPSNPYSMMPTPNSYNKNTYCSYGTGIQPNYGKLILPLPSDHVNHHPSRNLTVPESTHLAHSSNRSQQNHAYNGIPATTMPTTYQNTSTTNGISNPYNYRYQNSSSLLSSSHLNNSNSPSPSNTVIRLNTAFFYPPPTNSINYLNNPILYPNNSMGSSSSCDVTAPTTCSRIPESTHKGSVIGKIPNIKSTTSSNTIPITLTENL